MRNEDGYRLSPTVIEDVRVEGRFATFKTPLGTFSALKGWFTWIPARGTYVIICISGFADVLGIVTENADNFYVKPTERDKYDKALMGKE